MSAGKDIILVTGASGLIGQAIKTVVDAQTKALAGGSQETWIYCGSKDGDLRDKVQTDALFEKHRPTHVIHLAAMVGGIFHHVAHNLEFFRVNMAINDNVLNASFRYKVKKVVSCLSTCIFPDQVTYPIDETMVCNGHPHSSNYGYSYAKRMVDILITGYNESGSCLFTSVVPCNVFGPHDNFDTSTSHVIPALIRRMHDDILRGASTFTVMGSGTPLRQFMYSQDVAKLFLWTLRHYDSVEPIILSVDNSDEVTIRYAAEQIARAFGYSGRIECDTSKPDGQHKRTASNSRLRSLYKDFQFTPFDRAIIDTVHWFKSNRQTARI